MKTLDELPDIITPYELCELRDDLSVQTVRAACRKGTMPATKVGRNWYIVKKLFVEGKAKEIA